MEATSESKKLEHIVQGCVQHKNRSQKQLYKLFYGFGYGICNKYASSKEETEEMVHNGFLRIFKNIDTYDVKRSFKTWTRRIYINSAIDYYRKYGQYNSAIITDEPDYNDLKSDEDVLSKMTVKEIMRLIKQLSPAYRVAINLYVVEGFNHREIAAMLKISEGTSKSNLSKARQKLKQLIKDNYLIRDV